MGRWTVQSLLAGVDNMKLGYVTRQQQTDAYRHVILSTQSYKPDKIAQQMHLGQKNMWGIFKVHRHSTAHTARGTCGASSTSCMWLSRCVAVC
jgi:hypothetical protein